MASDETLSQEPGICVAVEIASATAVAGLAGGGWIGKAAKWGLGTGRLSAWVATYRVSQYEEVMLVSTTTTLTTGLFSTFSCERRSYKESTHQKKKNRNEWTYLRVIRVSCLNLKPGARLQINNPSRTKNQFGVAIRGTNKQKGLT